MEVWIFAAVIVLFFMWRMRPVKGVKTISTAELKDIIHDQHKVFIDVRTAGEYKVGHIKPFKNMPLGSDYSVLPKEKEIVVICQSGMRSMQACKQLKKLGYDNVINVSGGISKY